MSTVIDKLLLAALACEENGKSPFSAEDLVVAAWMRFPGTFGLSGYLSDNGTPAHPDSNRVFAEIMGAKPIRTRGWLVKVGVKMYELTESGRHAARLARGEDLPTSSDMTAPIAMARKSSEEVQKLIATRAVSKIERNAPEDLTFHDACMFWGITPHSTAVELAGRIAHVDSLIGAAEQALQNGRARFSHGGAGYSSKTVDMLMSTRQTLALKFATELATISKRNDQRSR